MKSTYEIELKDNLSTPLKKATNTAQKFDQEMKKSTKSTKGFNSSMGGLGKAMAGFGSLLAVEKVIEWGTAFVTAGAEMEKTRISFQTLVGGVDKGNKLFEQVSQFANVTPFSTKGVQKAGRTLLAFGVAADNVVPTLNTLGDISAGTGKDLSELGVIYGQIRGAGRLMGQDLLQLINAGFNPLQTISKRTGESMSELKKRMSKGKISFQEVQQAMVDATSEGGLFFNMSKKQSKTLAGLWSTFTGKLQNSMAKLSEGGMKPLTVVMEGLIKASDFIFANFHLISNAFSPVIEHGREMFSVFSDILGFFFKGGDAGQMFANVLTGLKVAFNILLFPAKIILKVLTSIFSLLKGFAEEFSKTNAFEKLSTWFLQAANSAVLLSRSFMTAFEGIAKVHAEFMSTTGKSLGALFSGDFKGAWDAFKGGGSSAISSLKASFNSLGEEISKSISVGIQTGAHGIAIGRGPKIKKAFAGPTEFGRMQLEADGTEGSTTTSGTTTSSTVGSMSSGRPTNVSISIGKLVEQLTVSSTDVTSTAEEIQIAVTRALLSAVNDVNLIAK